MNTLTEYAYMISCAEDSISKNVGAVTPHGSTEATLSASLMRASVAPFKWLWAALKFLGELWSEQECHRNSNSRPTPHDYPHVKGLR